jgi:ubiquinone/menaquinone biosynthesis C-methylase UbiE
VSLYERYILPPIVDRVCSRKEFTRQREQIVPLASGVVLEIGSGSGLNARFYDPARVERVWSLEPNTGMLARASRRTRSARVPIEPIVARAEEIPLPDRSVDAIVTTYTLCTIGDVDAALGEMKRLLRPGGRLLFSEHGAAPEERILRWQNRINPLWKRVGGGCNLNRNIAQIIERAGFRIEDLTAAYIQRFKIASFNYRGIAVPTS